MRDDRRRSETREVLRAAEATAEQLARMVERLTTFTDHLDALAAERDVDEPAET